MRSPRWTFLVAILIAAIVITMALLFSRSSTPTTPATTPTVAAAIPIGKYECNGNEAGMVVGVGWFDIQADGTIADLAYYTNGTWQFDPTSQTFTFTGAIDVGQAVYHPNDHTATFTLKTGQNRPHVEGATFICVHQP